jgi:hypothetical protein
VISIERRLVWGPLPSESERDAFFAPRTAQSSWMRDTFDENDARKRRAHDLSRHAKVVGTLSLCPPCETSVAAYSAASA